MTRLSAATLIILPFVLASCLGKQEAKSKESPAPATAATQTSQTPSQAAPTSPGRKGRALVTKLPKGAEGLALADGGLRALDGYEFVKDKDGTLVVARIQDPHRGPGPRVWCRCSSGAGTCSPGSEGPLAVCKPDSNCSTCVLGVTIGGVSTNLFAY